MARPRRWKAGARPEHDDLAGVRTNAPDVAVAHAARGLGVAMVLAYQAADLVRSGALEILLLDHEPRPLPIQLVVPGGRFVSANARAFIDLTVATRRWDYVDFAARARKAAGVAPDQRRKARVKAAGSE